MFRKLLSFLLLLGTTAHVAAVQIKLVSSDDQEFAIEKTVAEQSVTIKNLLEDYENNNENNLIPFIPLDNIDGKTLGLVVAFLNDNTKNFDNLTLSELINLTNVANFLDITNLLDATTMLLANFISANKKTIKAKDLVEDYQGNEPFDTYIENNIKSNKNIFLKIPGNVQELVNAKMPFELFKTLESVRFYQGRICAGGWSPNGKFFASRSGNEKKIKIWDVQNWKVVKTHSCNNTRIGPVAWSPSGDCLAWSDGSTITIVDDEKSLTLSPGGQFILSLAWSPDGTQLASGSWDGSVIIWDVQTGNQLQSFTGTYQGNVYSVAWSPDGNFLAFSSNLPFSSKAEINIVDTQTWQIQETLAYKTIIKSLAWSPDSKKLAAGLFQDNNMRVWDLQTKAEVTINMENRYTWLNPGIHSVAWSPDGKLLASYYDAGFIKIFDVKTWQLLQTIDNHSKILGEADCILWSPDGTYLASCRNERFIEIWARSKIISLCSQKQQANCLLQ